MQLLEKQFRALMESSDNPISLLANASAFLYEQLDDVSWVGFYLYDWDKLVLGPFQGKVACTKIPMGKGVCGTAAKQQQTIIVEDVNAFPGHIACDSASRSEIVIPMMIDNTLYGVLDIDSPSYSRFTNKEAFLLEKCVNLLCKAIENH